MTEIKTVPYVPLSHPFVERLIGTIRRELLDRTLFWTVSELETKLIEFQHYDNGHRTHAGLEGRLPDSPTEPGAPIDLAVYRWQKLSRLVSDSIAAYFLKFAMDSYAPAAARSMGRNWLQKEKGTVLKR
ncbi:MAG TPA: integrase core domain-containing protein [Bryobacteraceae bacterium]